LKNHVEKGETACGVLEEEEKEEEEEEEEVEVEEAFSAETKV
jgi:hypothetical protein